MLPGLTDRGTTIAGMCTSLDNVSFHFSSNFPSIAVSHWMLGILWVSFKRIFNPMVMGQMMPSGSKREFTIPVRILRVSCAFGRTLFMFSGIPGIILERAPLRLVY